MRGRGVARALERGKVGQEPRQRVERRDQPSRLFLLRALSAIDTFGTATVLERAPHRLGGGVQELAERGADVNRPRADGVTPMMLATGKGATVALLESLGAEMPTMKKVAL